MRPLTALLILAACHYCQCLHAHAHPRTPRDLLKETFHKLLGKQTRPIRRILTCTETLGASKCISALGVWRAERALQAFETHSKQCDLVDDVDTFPWKTFTNTTDEEIQSKLLDGTERLLQYRPLTFDMISGYSAKLHAKENGSVSIDIHTSNEVEGRSTMKKLQKEFYRYAPVLIAPGLFLAAFIPFFLPSFKMMVLMVGMMNQMALVGAIFTVLRNNAFNDKYEHKVVYVNNGYENERLKIAASNNINNINGINDINGMNNEEHFHTNHLGILYEDPKSRFQTRPVVHPPFENFDDNIEEIPPLSVNPQWIKEYTDNKMLAMMGNKPDENVFFNGNVPIRRSKPEAKVEKVDKTTS